MKHRVPVYQGHVFLGGRAVAHQVRTTVLDLLKADTGAVVVVDFANVEGVSHSFADELLSPLSEALGHSAPTRVKLVNCSPDVLADLRSVARMHHLEMPGTVGRTEAALAVAG